jgi:hypothetical protein
MRALTSIVRTLRPADERSSYLMELSSISDWSTSRSRKGIDAARGIGGLFSTNRRASVHEGGLASSYACSLCVVSQKVEYARFLGASSNLDTALGRHGDGRKTFWMRCSASHH